LSDERKSGSEHTGALALEGRAGAEAAGATGGRAGRDAQPARRAPLPARRADRRVEQRLTVLPAQQPAKDRRSVAERVEPLALPPPVVVRRRPWGQYISFAVVVGIPLIVASVYYGFIASNQYVAEFRFSVSNTTPSVSSVSTSVMAALSGGSSTAPLENYIVADYLTSRQVVDELQHRIKIRDIYAKPTVDWWARFDASQPMEKFVDYWQEMVTSSYDLVTGIATARIRAFTPEDAFLVANTMVKLSEELVNKIANRSNIDNVKFAEKEVERAQQRVKDTAARMTEYRNKVGVIDPKTSVVAGNSTIQTTLQANLATLETQLTSLLGRHLLSTSPAVRTLQNQIKATKEQLAAIERTVEAGKDRAGGAALSAVVAEYEQLDLERQFSQTMLTSAMEALEQARATAALQHLYITPYVRPSLPQSSTYPRRLFSIMMTGLIAFAAWVVGLLIVRSIRERFG
jgi:capsular polysaccharide transport system permease protein